MSVVMQSEKIIALRRARERPNPEQTWDELAAQLDRDELPCGVAYAWVAQDGTVRRVDPREAVRRRPNREATGYMDLDAPLTLFGLPVVCSDTGEPMTRRDVMGPGDELRPAERN